MKYTAYLEDEVMSASKSKLVIMLFDGAIKFLKRLDGLDYLTNLETKCYNINKTNAIISELQCTLNMEYAEISKPLFSLYNYMSQKLLEANLYNNPVYVKEVVDMLQDLRATWKQIDNEQTTKKNLQQEDTETVGSRTQDERVSFSIAC